MQIVLRGKGKCLGGGEGSRSQTIIRTSLYRKWVLHTSTRPSPLQPSRKALGSPKQASKSSYAPVATPLIQLRPSYAPDSASFIAGIGPYFENRKRHRNLLAVPLFAN